MKLAAVLLVAGLIAIEAWLRGFDAGARYAAPRKGPLGD